jgi:hypothetical protein
MTLAFALMFRNEWARVICKAGAKPQYELRAAYMPDVTRAVSDVPRASYARYYDEKWTRLALDKDAPVYRPILRTGAVRSVAILGGLHPATPELFSAHTGLARKQSAYGQGVTRCFRNSVKSVSFKRLN